VTFAPVGPIRMSLNDARAAKYAELWLVDLAGSAAALEALEHELPRLGARDRAAMLAGKGEARRQKRFVVHVALRVLLERALGRGVRGADFARAPGAKPRLPGGGDLEFSLAHGDAAALIGVARGTAIGVDLEHVRPVRIAQARRQRMLWAGAALIGAEDVDVPAEEAFMRAWVRLEAVAKADGSGLARTLSAFGVRHAGPCGGRDEVAVRVRSHLSQTGLKVHDLPPLRGSVAALALDAAMRVPLLRAFPTDRSGIEAVLGEPAPDAPAA
jgi:4'-phosphopantetheinyl transferase